MPGQCVLLLLLPCIWVSYVERLCGAGDPAFFWDSSLGRAESGMPRAELMSGWPSTISRVSWEPLEPSWEGQNMPLLARLPCGSSLARSPLHTWALLPGLNETTRGARGRRFRVPHKTWMPCGAVS